MKPSYLTFALDALAIAVVAVLGLARVLPPEAVIGFFCTVWAAGRRGPGDPPPAAPSSGALGPQVRAGVRDTLISRALITFARFIARPFARGTPLRSVFA